MARVARPLAFALLASLTGCALAYSFDTLTGGTEPVVTTDGGADALAESATDAAPTRWCASVDADFCDDFDDDAALGSRWDMQGAVVSPVLTRDASVAREDAEAIALLSPPNMVRMRAAGLRSKAAFFQYVKPVRDGGVRRGVEVSVAVRATKVSLAAPVEAGRLEGAVVLGVITEDTGFLGGVGLVVRQQTMNIYQTLGVDGGDNAKFTPIGPFDGSTIWGRLRLVIGPRSEALARGMTSCQSFPEGMVAASQIGPLHDVCMSLEAPFTTTAWLDHAAFALGPVLFGDGEAEMLVDNVIAEVF